jgi:hypothetical protein
MTEEHKKDESIEMPKIDIKDVNLGNSFQKFLQIVKLDKKAIEDVSKDKKGATGALIFLVVGALASPLAMAIFGVTLFGITVRPAIGDVFIQAILAVIMAGLVIFITSLVAIKLFKGHGTFSEYFRIAGLTYGLNVIGIISFIIPSFGMLIGLLVGIWMLVINYIAIKIVFKLDDTNTVLTMIVTVVVFMLLSAIVASTGFGVMSSSSMMPSFSIS